MHTIICPYSDHFHIFADHIGSSSEEKTCPDPETPSELSASGVRDCGNNRSEIVDVSTVH